MGQFSAEKPAEPGSALRGNQQHMAINLLRRPPGKQSLRGRRKAASWDDDFLASLIAT